jgi:hypothetical protein
VTKSVAIESWQSKVGNRKCVVIEILAIKNLATKFLWQPNFLQLNSYGD